MAHYPSCMLASTFNIQVTYALFIYVMEQEHSDDILVCAYCPPNSLATASYDGEIIIWNATNETYIRHLRQRCKKNTIRRRANTIKMLQQRKNRQSKEKSKRVYLTRLFGYRSYSRLILVLYKTNINFNL